MLIEQQTLLGLSEFGHDLGLVIPEKKNDQDKSAKMLQVLAYLEAIHVHVNKYSTKRELVLVEAGAGNCYLSLMAYHFYANIVNRPVRIHCIDTNAYLMAKNADIAKGLGFANMHFHASDIADVELDIRPDAVYALHACEKATDKALFLGIQTKARNVLTVSCCQHSFRKSMRLPSTMGNMASHPVLREKLVHMTADSMRALLMELAGFKASLVEMVSSRATEKNLMLRSERLNQSIKEQTVQTYLTMRRDWRCAPSLETYMLQAGLLSKEVSQSITS